MYTELALRLNAPKIDSGRARGRRWLLEDDEDVVRERMVGCAGGDGGRGVGCTVDVRKGREMVVTRMEFLRSALSGTFAGMKLMSTSKGRWDGSGGGSVPEPRRESNEPIIEEGLDDGRDDVASEERCADERWVEELPGEVGMLWEPKRDVDGGRRSPWRSVSSDSSSTPPPPCFLQVRATRSAHSRTLTKRTAPASSRASGAERRRTRTVGMTIPGMSGGAWVARMTRDFAR